MASSSSDTRWIHDVFLSFRGEDTRKNFVSHLHAALSNEGINTLIDDMLRKGTELGAELVRAIQGSRISIVVFSVNYASSKWCLNELVKIMECRRTYGQLVVPVFYHVDPSHVRQQWGAFGERLETLAQTHDVLNSWRSALTEAANLAGWDVRNMYIYTL
ncbi:TMV resistance protein N [Spatholobus suberectus]|nr:TMV resistance protein N [Spatholobus suberectus]